jgi:hypothetical protein
MQKGFHRGHEHQQQGWFCVAPGAHHAHSHTFCKNKLLFSYASKVCHCGNSCSPKLFDTLTNSTPSGVYFYPIDPFVRHISQDSASIEIVPFEDIGNWVLQIKIQFERNSDNQIYLDTKVPKDAFYPKSSTVPKPLSWNEILPDSDHSRIARPSHGSDLPSRLSGASLVADRVVVVTQPSQPLQPPLTISTAATSGLPQLLPPAGGMQAANARNANMSVVAQQLASPGNSELTLDSRESRAAFIDSVLPSSTAGKQSLTSINTQFNLSEDQVEVFAKIYDLDNGNNLQKTTLIEKVKTIFTEAAVGHFE